MKNFAQLIVIALICGSCATHDGLKIGRFDQEVQALRHEIAFVPVRVNEPAHFMATLKNTSNRNLSVMVNNRGFHSTLTLKTAKGQKYEVFEEKYLHLLQTSTWFDPIVELAAGRTIHWKIPLSSVVTVLHGPVTQESINGGTITSELSVSGTKIKSKPIKIQKEGLQWKGAAKSER